MNILVRWCEEKNGILCWTFDGRWTWTHLRQAIETTRALGEAHPGRVDLIIDVREMALPPANLTAGFQEFARMDFGFRAGGINVLVGMDAYLTILWDVLATRLATDWQIKYAETLEEAHTIIQQDRTSV